jgi:hypothetical protein
MAESKAARSKAARSKAAPSQGDGPAGGVARRLRGSRAREALDLRRRVSRLEAEVQECRALNVRLAELTDIVTELLLPVASRDEATLAGLLEKYRQSV